MKPIKGIIAALITPFDDSGKIDELNLRRLVADCIARGIDGFYVCGSSGEAFLLSQDERKRILEVVVDENAGRTAIISHIGSIGTGLTIDLGRHACSLGVDAVSSIPPFYYKFSTDEVLAYYLDIADALDTRLIPYNFPALSGFTLTGDLVQRLRTHPRVAGIKFTSNDLFQMERMKHQDPNLIVYNGYDEIFLAGLTMGADGAIGSTFNLMPEKFIGIKNCFNARDFNGAQKLQEEANHIIQSLIDTGKLLNAIKYLLGLRGIPCGSCRKPFLQLTDTDKQNLDSLARTSLNG
jgi:N-acetylneuraminate lyase